ncbi:hypothetical protein BC831DRAFT_469670 [Entophlyctis helioformis]|nr:hypothetical protein BC831DRAFT_469670 [Entophlyctis helioformis]
MFTEPQTNPWQPSQLSGLTLTILASCSAVVTFSIVESLRQVVERMYPGSTVQPRRRHASQGSAAARPGYDSRNGGGRGGDVHVPAPLGSAFWRAFQFAPSGNDHNGGLAPPAMQAQVQTRVPVDGTESGPPPVLTYLVGSVPGTHSGNGIDAAMDYAAAAAAAPAITNWSSIWPSFVLPMPPPVHSFGAHESIALGDSAVVMTRNAQ